MAKKRMKLTRLLVIICIFIFSIASGSLKAAEKNEDEEINLEGQWKVTDYLTSGKITAAYDYHEDYLGRSIIIEPNRIIESFSYCEQEDVVSPYRTVEMETVNGGTYGSGMGNEWYWKYAEQDITVVTFDMQESAASSTFVITEEGEVLCWYMLDIYYMERYREAVTDLREEELYGKWKVRRLVSYQDGWRGRNGLFYGTEYREEDGGYFYPESYLGNTVCIREDGIKIYNSEGRLLDSLGTDGYASYLVDKYDYQNRKGIHDELGLTNEEIQVFAGNIREPEDTILDGEIMAVSRTEVIIKIYQGWYLLEKM